MQVSTTNEQRAREVEASENKWRYKTRLRTNPHLLALRFSDCLCVFSTTAVKVRSYHWEFSARPASCAVSCSSEWRALRRSQRCLNGLGQVIALQYCLDNTNPNNMFPSLHPMMNPCDKLNCSQTQTTNDNTTHTVR